MIAILAHGRQVEWTARLDFLWQLQASHEKREMAVLQESNKHILYNLLPAHVAAHFLDNQFRNNMVNTLAVFKHTILHYTKTHKKCSFCLFFFPTLSLITKKNCFVSFPHKHFILLSWIDCELKYFTHFKTFEVQDYVRA